MITHLRPHMHRFQVLAYIKGELRSIASASTIEGAAAYAILSRALVTTGIIAVLDTVVGQRVRWFGGSQ